MKEKVNTSASIPSSALITLLNLLLDMRWAFFTWPILGLGWFSPHPSSIPEVSMAPLSVTRKRETSCTSLTGVFPHLLGQLPTKDVTVQPVPPGGDSYKQLLISLASWKVGFLGQQVPSGTQVGLGKGSQAVGSCVTSISPLWPLWSSCWHWVSGDGLMPIG